MAFDIEAAKAEGYTDQEISAYLAEEAKKPKKEVATPPVMGDEPPPSTTVVPEISHGAEWTAIAAGGGGDIFNKAKELAIPAGEGYLAYKGIQAYRENAAANQARAAAEAAAEQGRAARAAARVPAPVAPQAPAPATATASRPLLQPGQAAPVAPEPLPPQAANAARGAATAEGAGAGNWMANALNMAKTYGPALARIGGTAAAALTPGNVGQNYNVPQVGRMKGMEINPLTGRPWTPDQIAQYSANPAMYDQQLAAPQFRR